MTTPEIFQRSRSYASKPDWRQRYESVSELIRDHLPFLLLMCIAALPLFGDLGEDYLWADEGDTAVLAKSILQFGVPKAWDGITFTDSDMGARENKDLVMVSHPWLQYYVTAASFCLFGENAFAARVPFALAGFLTLPVLYLLILRCTKDRRAALCASLLLILSVQFLLFSRQARNYSLNTLLTCLLLLAFFNLGKPRSKIWFTIVAVLGFHCHPSSLAPIAALAFLTLFHRPFHRFRRGFWMSFPIIMLLTLPWFLLARGGYAENTSFLKEWRLLLPRLLQFFIECGSVTPVVAVIVLFSWLWIRQWRESKPTNKKQTVTGRDISYALLAGGERDLVITILFVFLSYSGLVVLSLSRVELWNVGLRHTPVIIPLTFALTGLLVSKVSRSSLRVYIWLLILLAFTKVGRLTPWSFQTEGKPNFGQSDIAAMHAPKTWRDRLFRTALPAFSRELWLENHGTIAHLCRFLKTNAAPGEVLITNYEWEPLYFHTGLPQGLKILPTYPIYDRALQLNLPFYVYTVKDARWLIWRRTWGNYRDYDWDTVHQSLLQSGARVTPITSVPETGWENRDNIHFRRFPGEDYKFPFYENLRDVEIYRIDWPWTKNRPKQATNHQA